MTAVQAGWCFIIADEAQWRLFDRVINIAGPWSNQLLQQSGLPVQQGLDLVRGSHLLLPPLCRYGHMLEVPGEQRIVFVLPYQGQTFAGNQLRCGKALSSQCNVVLPSGSIYWMFIITILSASAATPISSANLPGCGHYWRAVLMPAVPAGNMPCTGNSSY